jgi:hypothetical protein
MKTKWNFLMALVLLATLLGGNAGSAYSHGQESAAGTMNEGWSPFDNIEKLKGSLKKVGYTWQEGKVNYLDYVKDTCEGLMVDTAFNNPAPNAYATLILPPPPGGNKFPLEYLWQLGEQEAIVIVGNTPPAAKYFSYQTLLGVLPISPWPPSADYVPFRIAPSVGDALNIKTIKTIGPSRVGRPIVIIITGHRGTEQAVRRAVLAAGYPDAIINVETIAPALGPLGINGEGSWYYWAHRVAVPESEDELLDYLRGISDRYKVFRVTPNQKLVEKLGDDPEPVPLLRIRGTGHTEMDLYPTLKLLRQAILDHYAGKQYKELDTHVYTGATSDGIEVDLEKPYAGLQRNIQVLGATRDTNYLGTYPNFRLRQGKNEFVIVYGVNHQLTGKATYSSISAYADKYRWFGVGTKLSTEFENSARDYLPADQYPDPNIDLLYAIKVARDCTGELHCLEINQPTFLDLWGNPYPTNPSCSLDHLETPEIDPSPFDIDLEDLFFLFRSYMEPETNVSPDDNELLYDRAIYFGPYDFPPE